MSGGKKFRKAKKGGDDEEMTAGKKFRKAKKGGDDEEMTAGKKNRKNKKGGILELTPFISALALFGARMYNESRMVSKKSRK